MQKKNKCSKGGALPNIKIREGDWADVLMGRISGHPFGLYGVAWRDSSGALLVGTHYVLHKCGHLGDDVMGILEVRRVGD